MQKIKHIVSIDESLCKLCGKCREDCPDGALIKKDNVIKHTGRFCVKCGHCVAICPEKAVSISGYEDPPEEIDPDSSVDPDALLAQIKARRSTRQFLNKHVSPEDIAKIIEAGRYTPTGGNKQGVSYVVIRETLAACEKVAISRLRLLKPLLSLFRPYLRRIKIDDRFLFKGAPVVIVIVSENKLDGALAASTMELMARSLGLGALYSGFFTSALQKSKKLKRMLSIAPWERVVATLVIGHPDVQYHRTAQRERAFVIYK